MSDIPTPGTLIVIQTVFGFPMRGQESIRARDVNDLVSPHLGEGNCYRVLTGLVRAGWLKKLEDKEDVQDSRGGRPAAFMYKRTPIGQKGYLRLKISLARYDIVLR